MSATSFEGQLEFLCSSLTLQDASAAIQTLIKIIKNALEHPGEEHYRHLHTTNKTFSTKVWRHSNAREFMLSVGWVLLEDSVVLPSDNLLQDALVALTKTKSVLDVQRGSPSPVRHSSPTHSSPTHPDKGEESPYQERMRKMKELQKHADLEKKRIAEQIKADRRETNQRKAHASHSTDLRFGGMTTYDDIGVHLNKGGG